MIVDKSKKKYSNINYETKKRKKLASLKKYNGSNGSSNGSSDLNPIELNEKLSDMLLEDLKKPRKPTLN